VENVGRKQVRIMHGKMNPEFPKAHIFSLQALLEKLSKGMCCVA